jgi:hypothetical protein
MKRLSQFCLCPLYSSTIKVARKFSSLRFLFIHLCCPVSHRLLIDTTSKTRVSSCSCIAATLQTYRRGGHHSPRRSGRSSFLNIKRVCLLTCLQHSTLSCLQHYKEDCNLLCYLSAPQISLSHFSPSPSSSPPTPQNLLPFTTAHCRRQSPLENVPYLAFASRHCH